MNPLLNLKDPKLPHHQNQCLNDAIAEINIYIIYISKGTDLRCETPTTTAPLGN